MFSMQSILLILALAFIIPSPAKGTVENAIGTEHVLHFSAGWRTNESSPQNVLQLGIVFPCGIGWCVEYEEFPGKANLPRTRLPYRHAMVAPYGTHQCTDEHVTTIHGVIHSDVPAQLIDSEGGFILQADSFEYRWDRDTSEAGGFVLVKASRTGSDEAFAQPVGFAYKSEHEKGRLIQPGDLRASFDGQIAHKDMSKGVMDDWLQKQSTIDFRKFNSSSANPLMAFDQPGLPNVVRKYNKPMLWVHHSVFVAPTISGRLNYVVHEYGHDFNANGCFDDFGHNKLLLPILHGGSISALVYIEYSPDPRDGVPMISVGRYFRKE
jgi:hypothetical protein